MRIFRTLKYLPLAILILLNSLVLGQSGRVIGILPFHNDGNTGEDWISKGIDEFLYEKLSILDGLSVYEKETLNIVLKQLEVEDSNHSNAKRAFSIGKLTGIQVLFMGNYKVDNGEIIINFRLVSTYTGAPILKESYTTTEQNLFSSMETLIKKSLEIMVVPISDSGQQSLNQRPTTSMEAFKLYCKAHIEIDKHSPLEIIAGFFDQALRSDPDFLEAQYKLGVLFYNYRLYSKALKQFNTVIQKDNNFYKAYFGKGVIYYLDKKFNQALTELKNCIAINPEYDRSYYYLGIVYIHINSLKKAIIEFENSININPNFAPAHYQLGNAEMKRGWFKKSIYSLTTATKLDPGFYRANNALGEAYYAINMYEEAIIEFKKAIILKPNYATAHFNLGNAIYRKGALAEIVDSFWSLLEVQFTSLGTNGNKAVKENPLDGLEALREKSRIEDNSKLFNEMIFAYKTALKYDDRFYEASYNLALTYENMEKPDSAEIFYKKAISQNYYIAQAHMRLGRLYESKKQYELALSEFKDVVKIEPDFFAGSPKLGEPYRYINIIESVLNESLKSLNLDPHNKDALEVIGKIHLSLGRFGQAEEYYQQLVELSPNNIYAQQTLREIRRQLKKL